MTHTHFLLGATEGDTSSRFWEQVLFSPTALWCVLTATGCLAVIAVGLLALRRAHRALPRQNPLRSADGTATIEFALVTPILLFFALVLTQTTMLMGGHIFVNYPRRHRGRPGQPVHGRRGTDQAREDQTGGGVRRRAGGRRGEQRQRLGRRRSLRRVAA